VTDHRTCDDSAECMRDLVDIHYPDAKKIRVVMDDLPTHSMVAVAVFATVVAAAAAAAGDRSSRTVFWLFSVGDVIGLW
jgi:hypothetical protein